MKALFKNVIIECGDPYEEEKSSGLLSVQIDPQFNPTKYSKTTGRVVSAGHKTSNLYTGDTIFFHFGALDISPQEKEVVKGQYIIEFKDIFCKRAGDELQALGRWVLCEPVEKKVPDGYVIETVGTTPMLVSEASGIVADRDYQSFHTNIVRVISHPNGLYEGKNVMVPDDCDFDNYGRTIDGKTYFYVEEDLIDAVYE
jgi:hypothetical protein